MTFWKKVVTPNVFCFLFFVKHFIKYLTQKVTLVFLVGLLQLHPIPGGGNSRVFSHFPQKLLRDFVIICKFFRGFVPQGFVNFP